MGDLNRPSCQNGHNPLTKYFSVFWPPQWFMECTFQSGQAGLQFLSSTVLNCLHIFCSPAIPDPVTFVQNSSQTTATSVSFSWLPPAHNGNKEILRYWIRYYQADSTASESNSAQAVSRKGDRDGIISY